MTTDIDTTQAVSHLPRRAADTPDLAALVDARVRGLSKFSEMQYVMNAPETEPCGYKPCGAARGWDCQSRTGNYLRAFHGERTKAVEHLTDAEKIRAYALLKVEQELSQRETRARMAEREADPVYVAERDATRQATGEAWRQIGREVSETARKCRRVYLHESGCDCRLGGVAKVIPFPGEYGGRPVTHLDDVRGRAVRRPLSPFRGGGDVA